MPFGNQVDQAALPSDKFHVKLQGVEELVLVKMATMRLVEP